MEYAVITTPLVSEEENDHALIGASTRFMVRKSFPVLALADANHCEDMYENLFDIFLSSLLTDYLFFASFPLSIWLAY